MFLNNGMDLDVSPEAPMDLPTLTREASSQHGRGEAMQLLHDPCAAVHEDLSSSVTSPPSHFQDMVSVLSFVKVHKSHIAVVRGRPGLARVVCACKLVT